MSEISRKGAQSSGQALVLLPSARRPCVHDSGRGRAGFSLLELLVVIAIIGLLISAAVPALNSVMESGRLTQATALVVNQLTLAKQKANAENKNITVRFIRKDTSSPFDRIQLVSIDSDDKATPVTRLTMLPTQTAIASDVALSSLMGITESSANNANDPSLPELGTSYRYKQFAFLPRGSLDGSPLTIQSNWFVTVVFQRDASSDTAPKNFACIQIDPVNGGLQIYRP